METTKVTLDIGVNFEGANSYVLIEKSPTKLNWTPPDVTGAVGPNHYVQILNGPLYGVYDKTGKLISQIVGNGFWQNDWPLLDQHVLYDPLSGRWFAVGMEIDGQTIHIGITTGQDPSAENWNHLTFKQNEAVGTTDFPMMAVDNNAFYLGFNDYNSKTKSEGAGIVVVPKSSLLSASPTTDGWFQRTMQDYTVWGNSPYPVIDTFNLNKADHGFFIGADNAGSEVLKWSWIPTGPVDPSMITHGTIKLPLPYLPTTYGGSQTDGSKTLDTGGPAAVSAPFQVGDDIWYVHAVQGSKYNQAAVRWYRISYASMTVQESGEINQNGFDFYNPSIAANPNGSAVICLTRSGSQAIYGTISFMVATKIAGDDGFNTPELVKPSSNQYPYHPGQGTNRFADRWGDFSSVTVDPENFSRFWVTNEYAIQGGTAGDLNTNLWGTYIAEIIMPE